MVHARASGGLHSIGALRCPAVQTNQRSRDRLDRDPPRPHRARARRARGLRPPPRRHRRIHDLRHTAASLLIAAGADVKAVETILGHSTATMTMDLYGRLFTEATWAATDKMPTYPDPTRQNPGTPEPPHL